MGGGKGSQAGTLIATLLAHKAAGRKAEAAKATRSLADHVGALEEKGDAKAAVAALDVAAREMHPHPAELHDLGCLFAERSMDRPAALVLRAVYERLPGHPQVMRNLAQVLMRQGDLEGSRKLAREQLARRPGDSFALTLAAVAATESGDGEEAARLMDFPRFVRTVEPEPPAGYPTIAAFNEALCENVLNRADLKQDPRDRTTRGGRQSGALFPAAGGPLADLQTMIGAAVKDYSAALSVSRDHPFLAQRPSAVRLHGWATVIDTGGYQQPHIHPSGWLSGVYYPRLPGLGSAGPESRAGWLVFGKPSSGFHPQAEYITHSVRPKEGMIVLFPSYFHHSTEPFAGAEARISIAFDIIPQR